MVAHVPKPESLVTLANRYQLLRELGSGGFGVVYEALDTEWNTRVALKTLQRMGPDALLRFKDEFRSLQDVEHPNLVQLIELTCSESLWFFTMELVSGTDFFNYVRPRVGDLSYLRVRALREHRLRIALIQLLDALAAIHESGRVHCDIKPSNIRVDASGRLVLLDFGLVTGGRLSQGPDGVLGTPSYMAPEQSRGSTVSPAADIYAVGVLIYEALTGELPHDGDTTRVLMEKQHQRPLLPQDLAPGVPDDLAALCMRVLDPEPSARPTGTEILRLLKHGDGAPPPSHSRIVRAPTVEQPVFVGRLKQLAWLQQRFEAARQGRPVFVYLSGESGVGKTALIRHFADQLTLQSGALVFQSRCFERETVPYKAFDGIADDLALHLSGCDPQAVRELLPFDAKLLVQIFPVLSRVKPIAELSLHRSSLDPHVVRSHSFAALREILARVSLARPLLLLIDDFQWTDLDSLALLNDLLSTPEAPGCLILATGRPVSQLSTELQEGFAPLLVSAQQLTLLGLEPAEAAQLGSNLAVKEHDPEALTKIAAEAKGHPLFLAELLRHVEAGHALPSGSDAPLFDQALRERVLSLEPRTRDLLQTLAVAAMPLPHTVLLHALQMAPTELNRRLNQLRIAHFVRSEDRQRAECYHDRVRCAVVDALPQEARRERHRALAEALSILEGGAEEQVAYQWRYAGETTKTARYFAQAAERAFRALAFKHAVTLYEEALVQHAEFGARELSELKIAYARALSCAGYASKAAAVYLEAAQGQTGKEARALRTQATLLMLRSGQMQEGVKLADDVLSELGLSRPKSPARALGRLLWERARLAQSGRHQRTRGEPGGIGTRSDVLELLWAVAPSLAFVDFLGGSALQSQYVRLALRSGNARHTIQSLSVEAISRSTSDAAPQEQVTETLGQIRRLADAQQSPYPRALALMSHAYVHMVNFRLSEAAGQFVQAERMFREDCVDVGWELTNARWGLLNVLWNAGSIAKHAELAREWLREAKERGDRYAATQLLFFGLAYQAALHDDDPVEAASFLAEPLDGWGDTFQLPHWGRYLGQQLVGTYQDEGGSHQLLLETWPRVTRSQLLRVPHLAFLTYFDAAGASLHEALRCPRDQRAALLQKAERFAQRLLETRRPLSEPMARQVRAQIKVLTGARDEAIALLREALQALTNSKSVYQYPTSYMLGVLVEGDEGKGHCERALNWAATEGIVDPKRWLSMFAPTIRIFV